MIKILRANLSRLWKTKALWICAAGAFVVNFINIVTQNISGGVYGGFVISIFISGIFTALFLGTDYSDGTIRNKFTVGASRAQVYFANLSASAVAAFVIAGAAQLVTALYALFAKKSPNTYGNVNFEMSIVVCVAAMLAACSFFTLMSMLIANKASVIVWAVLITTGLLFLSQYLTSRLGEEKTVYGSYYDESLGDYTEMHEYPNERYVSGTKRVLMNAADNILPFGGILKANSANTADIAFIPLYSLGTAAAVSVIGVFVFRKKDIK